MAFFLLIFPTFDLFSPCASSAGRRLMQPKRVSMKGYVSMDAHSISYLTDEDIYDNPRTEPPPHLLIFLKTYAQSSHPFALYFSLNSQPFSLFPSVWCGSSRFTSLSILKCFIRVCHHGIGYWRKQWRLTENFICFVVQSRCAWIILTRRQQQNSSCFRASPKSTSICAERKRKILPGRIIDEWLVSKTHQRRQ